MTSATNQGELHMTKLEQAWNEIETSGKIVTTTVPPDVLTLKTTSDKIRALDKLGWSRGAIRKGLGLKYYQQVRNTLVRPLKKPQVRS